MNSIALRYFLEVARCGSIAAAVERLHVAGSAVSRQIASLEYELGTPLFERQPRGMVMTDAGEKLAAHVRRAVLEEERVVAMIQNKGSQSSGTIKISCSQGLASHFLPEAARTYRHRFPDIRFDIRAQAPHEIVHAISEGDVDLGVAYSSGQHPGVSVTHRRLIPACVILSAKHPLAGKSAIDLRDLERFSIATSRDTTMREIINFRASLVGVRLDVVFECDYSDGLFQYCSSGEAVTFASSSSVANWVARGELVAVPLVDTKLFERNIEIQVMDRRTLPAHVEAFIDYLVSRLEEIEVPQ